MRKYFWKKALSLILVAAMTVSLASCGKKTPVSQPEITLSIDKLSDSEPIVKVVESAPVEESIYDAEIEAPAEETDREVASVEETTIVVPEKKTETVKEADIVETLIEKNLSSTSQSESSANPYINEKNELTAPFDIVYPEAEVAYAGNSLLLKMKNGFNGQLTKSLQDAGVGALEKMFEVENGTWYTGYIYKDTQVENVLANVRELSNVAVAELNYAFESTASTIGDYVGTNPQADEQWYLKKYGVVETYEKIEEKNIPAGGDSSVIVAVIDTGVDYNHIDLRPNMWKNTAEIPDNGIDDDHNGYVDDYFGVDIISKNGNGDDEHGHGTHVAGIIAAANNNEGVVGIAYNTKVMAIKAGDASGVFLQSNVAKAIMYAYENGAEVINMSFGGSACDIVVQDALAIAYNQCVLVASAGNDGTPNEITDHFDMPSPNYPGCLSYVLGVMSVGKTGVESSFSNWDANLYNKLEYEVYAPGEQILSTIPGDKYAVLSGTSMASPVVAAQAALLRSYYKDRVNYPTKFIYGQIVGTADGVASCANPSLHTVGGRVHNVPGIVNFYRSLVAIPTPDLVMSDYRIFDSVEFPADTERIARGCDEVNNGDGIVDAGEIVALGLTLKNRWGMSRDTVVSIDSSSSLGVANPYVTVLNNDVAYDPVGTYAESDSGKIYDSTGEQWTGWENPFYIKIDKNCPNNYSATLKVTITCKNGLDPENDTEYTSEASVRIVIRRGVVLPAKIDKNTTLTKDNYYIIPSSMIILPEATLTVEAGTKIQFYCSDPSDAYAENGIPYLKVQGNFICNGTAEEPVEIFPSDWRNSYVVEIYNSPSTGYVELNYTNITNPFIEISKAVGCEFTQYGDGYLSRRYLSSGTVRTNTMVSPVTDIRYASECAFYKLNHAGQNRNVGDVSHSSSVQGTFMNCMFVDCYLDFKLDYASFNDCVFYGNNTSWGMTSGVTSSFTVDKTNEDLSLRKLIYNPDNGKTYLYARLSNSSNYEALERRKYLFDLIGAKLANIGSLAELKFITENVTGAFNTGAYYKDGAVYNFDGSALPSDIPFTVDDLNYSQNKYIEKQYNQFSSNVLLINRGAIDYILLEIPGEIFVRNIELKDYLVKLDTDSSYKIGAILTPSTADTTALIYESEDIGVATVDENGLITPVSAGTSRIYVYSSDRAVSNYLTVNVVDTVELVSIDITNADEIINAGDTRQLKLKFTPSNTTKRFVSYVSSNPEVISVDDSGVVTALAEGCATVTVKGFGELEDTVNYRVVIPATGFQFANRTFITNMTNDDGVDFYPSITPANASIKSITWEPADPTICYVNEEGNLVKLKAGSTTLRAKLDNSILYDDLRVVIMDEASVPKIVDMTMYMGATYFALDSNGAIWMWGNTTQVPKKIIDSGVVEFTGGSFYVNVPGGIGTCYLFALDENQEVTAYNINNSTGDIYSSTKMNLQNVVSLSHGDSSSTNAASFFAIDKDGVVWAWGRNTYNALGLSSSVGDVLFTSPRATELGDAGKIVKITPVCQGKGSFLLDENGDVYAIGTAHDSYSVATKVASGVTDIYANQGSAYAYFKKTDGSFNSYNLNSGYLSSPDNELTYNKKTYKYDKMYEAYRYVLEDGRVLVYANKQILAGYGSVEKVSGIGYMSGITDPEQIFVFEDNVFVQEANGKFYAIGFGDNYKLGTGDTNNTGIPLQVVFGATTGEDVPGVTSTNLVEEETDGGTVTVLKGNTLEITFSDLLAYSSKYSDITLKDSGNNAATIVKKVDFNKLIISIKGDTLNGRTFTLSVPAAALKSSTGINCEAYNVTFMVTECVDEPVGDQGEEPDEEQDPEANPHDAIIDDELLAQRTYITVDDVSTLISAALSSGFAGRFYSNVILNRLTNDNVNSWMRLQAPSSSSYYKINLGFNYFGTTNETLVDKQIVDFDDYMSQADINEGTVLTEIPENVWPVLTSAYLTVDGVTEKVVGNQEVTFVVEFNRDMDTSIPLEVGFGSSYPYNDYSVNGSFTNPRKWEGTMTLTTLIENGYEYFSVSNGKAADADMKLYTDWGRFQFKIDTSAAQALIMQGVSSNTGIQLTWSQDDFETLAGYNVYRSDREDGQYTRINRVVIPADTKEFFDDTVEPGQLYYYNFTVVKSDLTESEPSGKISLWSADTMAPNIYHSPVYNAFTGSNLIISATITDNMAVEGAKVYYRTKGAEQWKFAIMNKANDKYSALIPAAEITTDGLEYYIEATDGNTFAYKGTSESPYDVFVQVGVSDNEMGDVDGNGIIELKDALMLLMAINDKLNLTEVQFARADLNGNGTLEAMEALKILKYVNGTIQSIL